MPSPNLALLLFPEQRFTVYGLLFSLSFVESVDLSALNNAIEFQHEDISDINMRNQW